MEKLKQQTKAWMIFFMISLFLSGLTAIPVEAELNLATRFFPLGSRIGDWLDRVSQGYTEMNDKHPFLAYGYDWLAFAHFVLAVLFIGPYKDPVKNKWIIDFGMIACVMIIPFALIAGHYRGLPLWWRLIDCSFGIIGLIPLSIVLRNIKKMEALNNQNMIYETI